MATSSKDIRTVEEARTYYTTRLARAHTITVHERRITIVFERDATHLFSVEPKGVEGVPVRRHLGGGRMEERIFDVQRARAMDLVLPALSRYTVAVNGTGPTGREKRLVYGPRLPSGGHMLVALRPGPGDAFTCVSAYEVTSAKWVEACRAKRARFPP